MDKSKGFIAILGMVLGLGADKVIELAFGIVDRSVEQSNLNDKVKRDNISSIIEVWQDGDTSVEEKSVYTSILLKNDMVPSDSACSLISFAINSKDAQEKVIVYEKLIDAFGEEFSQTHFSKKPCNMFALRQAKTENIQDAPAPKPNYTELETRDIPVCPIGLMYTQFGRQEQMQFGRTLTSKQDRYEITPPELIPDYSANFVTIRYFYSDDEAEALKWHNFLEANIKEGIDIKYAKVKGFEGKVPQNQFELWWPKDEDAPKNTEIQLRCN